MLIIVIRQFSRQVRNCMNKHFSQLGSNDVFKLHKVQNQNTTRLPIYQGKALIVPIVP